MNDPAVVLALHLLLVHSILACVAYYGNNHPMQQAYSILTQSESRALYEITISSLCFSLYYTLRPICRFTVHILVTIGQV